jgi:dTDP-4-dehydrorhamnose reductase
MGSSLLRLAVPDLGAGDVVFLMAGYISPAWIFENQAEAQRLNLDRSRIVADDIVEAGARLVFMSTDQVFDGRVGGYREDAQTAPLNLYGRMKVAMEQHVLGSGGIVARTGWNVGWDLATHCVVAQTYETLIRPNAQMAEDNVINVTDVRDTALGLLALAGREMPPSRVYHLASVPGITRRELADTIIRTSSRRAEMSYRPAAFATIKYSEPRPPRAWLANDRALNELGLAFTAPRTTIERKVTMLDGRS